MDIKNIKVGDYFKVDTFWCDDEDVLEWLELQPMNIFKVDCVELEVNGVWTKDCDFRFDLEWISTISEREVQLINPED